MNELQSIPPSTLAALVMPDSLTWPVGSLTVGHREDYTEFALLVRDGTVFTLQHGGDKPAEESVPIIRRALTKILMDYAIGDHSHEGDTSAGDD